MSLGDRLKELRKFHNLSRKELADLINVTPGSISHYETGRSSPKESVLFDLMNVLGCDPNYLFQDDVEIDPITFTTSIEEQKYLRKFRDLDERGQEIVKRFIDLEYRYCVGEEEEDKED